MYPPIDALVKNATAEGDHFTKPIVLCEFGHAMGNGPGALQDYHDAFMGHRRLQGGFIWEWANHGLWKQLEGTPSLSIDLDLVYMQSGVLATILD